MLNTQCFFYRHPATPSVVKLESRSAPVIYHPIKVEPRSAVTKTVELLWQGGHPPVIIGVTPKVFGASSRITSFCFTSQIVTTQSEANGKMLQRGQPFRGRGIVFNNARYCVDTVAKRFYINYIS